MSHKTDLLETRIENLQYRLRKELETEREKPSDTRAIRAELYDLQHHNCNDQLTIRADGTRDPRDHACTMCTRHLQLQAMLRDIDTVAGEKQ